MPSKQSASSELPKHQQDRKKWPGTSQTYSSRKKGEEKEEGREKQEREWEKGRRNSKKKKKITNTEENVAQGTEGNSSQYGIRYCK